MTTSFTTLQLSGQRVLVKGTDSQGTTGETVLDASQWEHLKLHQGTAQAQQEFDAAVEEFFAPLTEAAEKASKALQPAELDPISFLVLDEGSEGQEAKQRSVVKLNADSVVLRILEEGDHERLVWVAERLEVLAVLPGTGTPTATAGPEVHEGDYLDG